MDKIKDKLFEGENLTHKGHRSYTPLTLELEFYKRIAAGDIKGVEDFMSQVTRKLNSFFLGKMSSDISTQRKYTLVSINVLLVRVLMFKGIDEQIALSFSNKQIQEIPTFRSQNSFEKYCYQTVIKYTLLAKKFNYNRYNYFTIQALKYIGKHIEEKTTLSKIAKYLKISKVYVWKLFKRDLGKSVAAYITTRKLNLAKDYLETNNVLNIQGIAFRLHFSSASHFIQLFKSQFGLTPKKYLQYLAHIANVKKSD